MKKFLFAILAVMGFTASFAQQGGTGRVLVAYYSASGTTRGVATELAQAVGGDLYEITPAEAYTSADLSWRNKESRSSVEMKDPKSRPALAGEAVDVSSYDVVFMGFPVWWDQAPRVVNTFIESHSFKGKRVYPFATSGGSTIKNSEKVLRETYPDIDWQEGELLNRSSQVRRWVERLKL